MLLDPSTADVVGVIDWTDAAVGDPALDFAGLIHWQGLAFAREVADLYEGPRDADLLERARWHAIWAGIHTLDLGRTAAKPRWVRAGLRAIENALAG